MLQHLTHSKHKTISQCSAGALKNLYAAKPSGMLDMVSKGANYGMPSLQLRKRRNMVSCKKLKSHENVKKLKHHAPEIFKM